MGGLNREGGLIELLRYDAIYIAGLVKVFYKEAARLTKGTKDKQSPSSAEGGQRLSGR